MDKKKEPPPDYEMESIYRLKRGLSRQGSAPSTPPADIKPGSTPPIDINPNRNRTVSRNSSIHGSPSLKQRLASRALLGSGSISISPVNRVNIVTESCCFLADTVASTFSIEVALTPGLQRRTTEAPKLTDLGEPVELTTSCQEHLDKPDIFENPEYTDTVKSTDSTATLLRRTFSLPADYPQKKNLPRHAKDIFVDMYHHPDITFPPAPQRSDSIDSDYSEIGVRDSVHGATEDLLEEHEYSDSLQSTHSRAGLLAKAALEYTKSVKERKLLPTTPEADEFSISDEDIELEKKRFKKNLCVLSLCYMLMFLAYFAMRNLQSSLNADIGLESLCVLYGSLFASCIFTTTIVQRLRPRRTMILCFSGLIIYVASNFYPAYYTLLPASMIAGFSLANSYTAQATYLTNIAASYAVISGKQFPVVLTRFNGMYYMFFQLSQIIGGIISSVILKVADSHSKENSFDVFTSTTTLPENGTFDDNMTYSILTSDFTNSATGLSLFFNATEWISTTDPFQIGVTELSGSTDITYSCGSGYCPHQKGSSAGFAVNPLALYLLVAIFTVFGLLALAILFFCLDPLEGEMKKTGGTVLNQITACFRFFLDRKVVCLLPLMFYSLLQSSFMFGEFSQSFVTCSSGVFMVGYVMLTISTACAVSSFVNSKITKYFGRKVLIPVGYVLHLMLYVLMLLWTPTSDTIYVLFIIGAVWGVADGIFVTQVITMFGVLFQAKTAPAFAGLKICQASAACLFFLASPYFCTSAKISFMIVLNLTAAFGYAIMELLTYREKKLKGSLAEIPVKAPKRQKPVQV